MAFTPSLYDMGRSYNKYRNLLGYYLIKNLTLEWQLTQMFSFIKVNLIVNLLQSVCNKFYQKFASLQIWQQSVFIVN